MSGGGGRVLDPVVPAEKGDSAATKIPGERRTGKNHGDGTKRKRGAAVRRPLFSRLTRHSVFAAPVDYGSSDQDAAAAPSCSIVCSASIIFCADSSISMTRLSMRETK